MARPLWTGSLSFGLVNIPVGLHSAVDHHNELSFDLLHGKDGSRIEYRRFCKKEQIEVPWKEIVKGYEVARGKYVALSDEDFAKARVASTDAFEIRSFVPVQDIEHFYFEHPYYLAPAGKGAGKAYGLIRDALRTSRRVGIGTIVLRQREHLAALEPVGEALVLTTMRFAHEIRSPKDLDLPGRVGYDKRESALAQQLIQSLAGPWNPAEYRDTYSEVLGQIIRAKRAGKEIRGPSAAARPKIVDLTKALQESLKVARTGRTKRRPSRGRTRAA